MNWVQFSSILLLILQTVSGRAQSDRGLHLMLVTPGWLASNVPVDAPIIFYFNKPVERVWADQPFVKTWRAFGASSFDETRVIYTYLNSTNRTAIRCTYPGGWPPQVTIQGDYEGAYLQDLDGNRLGESGFVRFSTGLAPLPPLAFSGIHHLAEHQVRFDVSTYPGLNYVIQARTNLVADNWKTVCSARAFSTILSFTNQVESQALFLRACRED